MFFHVNLKKNIKFISLYEWKFIENAYLPFLYTCFF